MADDDPLLPSPNDPLSAQSARETAAQRLAGKATAHPRDIPYPWASAGDWLTEALTPGRIEQMFLGLGTDALGPGSLSGLSRAMQVPSRFVAPQARRMAVLDKLIANEDFNPIMHEGKLHFASLDAAENEEINRIGWSRAPDVTSEMETGPDKQAAWRQNIAYWRQLAEPSGR